MPHAGAIRVRNIRCSNSKTEVNVKGKLVDTRTGIALWEGAWGGQQSSGGWLNHRRSHVAAAVTKP